MRGPDSGGDGFGHGAASRLRFASLVLLTFAASCAPEPLPDGQEEQRLAAAQNRCSSDEQCVRAGCRQTLCRAAPDESFCEHRLVIAVDKAEPQEMLEVVRELIASSLTPRQLETLSVTAQSGSILVAFHAPLSQRARVEAGLAELESGGVFPAHPDSDAIARNIIDSQQGLAIGARRAEGGPLLVEAFIEGGDIVSFDDVRVATERLNSLVLRHLPPQAMFASETILDAQPPVVRAWILDPSQAVGFQELLSLNAMPKQGDERVFEGQFSMTGARALANLAEQQQKRALLFVVGAEVLAAAVLRAPITDGRFVLRIQGNDKGDQSMAERIRRLRSVSSITRKLRLDRAATQEAERAFACLASELAPCRCVEGYCQHQSNTALTACIEGRSSPSLP